VIRLGVELPDAVVTNDGISLLRLQVDSKANCPVSVSVTVCAYVSSILLPRTMKAPAILKRTRTRSAGKKRLKRVAKA